MGFFLLGGCNFSKILGVSSIDDDQGGVVNVLRVKRSQDQRNVPALFPHFTLTRVKTAAPMVLLVWQEVLAPGRVWLTWAGGPFAGTAGGGRRRESFAG